MLLITKVGILESLRRLLITVVMVILCMSAPLDPSDLGRKEFCKFHFDSRGCLTTFNFGFFKSENNFTSVREFSVSYIDENGTKETIVQCDPKHGDPECQNNDKYTLNWDGGYVSVSVNTKCVASGMYEFDIPYEQPIFCNVTAAPTENASSHLELIIGIVTTILFAVFFVLLVLICRCWLSKRQKHSKISSEIPLTTGITHGQELISTVTNAPAF